MSADKEVQVDYILNLLRQGEPRREIIRLYRERWSESVRTIDSKVAEAKRLLRKERAVINEVKAAEMQALAKDEIWSSAQKQKIVQSLIAELIEDLSVAEKIHERAMIYGVIARLTDLHNKMVGDYDARPNVNVAKEIAPNARPGRYFELVDARLKELQSLSPAESQPM